MRPFEIHNKNPQKNPQIDRRRKPIESEYEIERILFFCWPDKKAFHGNSRKFLEILGNFPPWVLDHHQVHHYQYQQYHTIEEGSTMMSRTYDEKVRA
jgi:hypothetical protein